MDRRMKLVGLTGGIASGKSAVAKMLRAAGIPVVDADELARDAVAPGTPALAAIAKRFGDDVILKTGVLDRKKLGDVVFADATARADLNAIVHPQVAALAVGKLEELRASGVEVAVYEVPLLFENGLEGMVDETLLVAASDDIQRARLMIRDNIDVTSANARIASQMSLDDKRKRASFVIENDGSLEETARQLAVLWPSLTGRALNP